jgi:hypothetical protein
MFLTQHFRISAKARVVELSVALAILLIPVSLLATEIIVIRTPEVIVIAADSKPTWAGKPGPANVCKIYRSGDLYVAVGGLDHDQTRNFYIKDLISAKDSSLEHFASQVRRLEEKITPRFLEEMKRLKAEDSTTYNLISSEGGKQLSLAFAKVQDGIPYFAIRGFSYPDIPDPKVEVAYVDCPGRDCPQGVLVEYMGKHAAIDSFTATHGGGNFNPVDLARKLVELEVQEDPEHIGPPIDILRLDATGPQWIANESNCPIDAP